MARRKDNNKNGSRKRNGNSGRQTPLGGLSIPTPMSPAAKAEELLSKAEETATVADIDALAAEPDEKEDLSLDEVLAKGNEALHLLEIQKKRYDAAEEKLQVRENALVNKENAIKELEGQVSEREKDLQPKIDQLTVRESELLQREAEVIKREADADAGFLRRNKEVLESLDAEMKELTKDLARHRSRMFKEREIFEEEKNAFADEKRIKLDDVRKQAIIEFETERQRLEEKIRKKEEDLISREQEIRDREANLRKEERKIALEHEILAEDQAAAENRAQVLVAKELESKEIQIRDFEARLHAAREDRIRLERVIADWEETDRRFGDRSPGEILEEIKTLRAERDALKRELDARPAEDAARRLSELERQRETWEKERFQFKDEISDLKNELNCKRIAVTELETLRNHKAALEASNGLLTKALEEEIRKVQELVRGPDGKSPFPTCSGMDRNSEYQVPRQTHDTIHDLGKFVDYVRHRMAYDPETEKALYYSLSDVRSFIGGLAMSRLHLLQGISGTGKTSLPKAFARAVGAGSSVIEVQAGWRDRQDLVGHFNAFEGRFYESQFLLSLYRASCPYFKDSPFIVVLDEMNLSHPEQYFADLLSALEQDIRSQELVLMSSAVDSPPSLFKDGRILQIPSNVWFVGTANHDETTKDFADKTYDRAHVMELPRHKDAFDINVPQAQNPISMVALENAFDEAKDKYSQEYETAYRFLEERLGGTLGKRFRVGWGNRLERQMENYVPVVIAAGGSIGEATDHIVATKLLRKIRDRHDNRPDDILALRDLLVSEWSTLDKKTAPVKSLGLLEEELHRLGHVED